MRVEVDLMQRVVLIDNHSPYGSLIFEKGTINNHVVVYQDSEDKGVRAVFESLDESAYFNQIELIEGLQEVISLLKEGG